LPSLSLMSVWTRFGYDMLILLAGLLAIPRDYHEAAMIDGASAWSRFWYVTLPALAPTFLFVSITTMIGYLQLFVEPYVMTQGGPLHATTSLVLYMFDQGFQWWHVGFAAALAFVVFLLTVIGAALQFRVRREVPTG